MDPDELERLGLATGATGKIKLYRGKGCVKCRGTGYHGRTGIFEVLPFSETIKQMTSGEADIGAIRGQARKEGMASLREDAVNKLLLGETTYQEVLKVTWDM